MDLYFVVARHEYKVPLSSTTISKIYKYCLNVLLVDKDKELSWNSIILTTRPVALFYKKEFRFSLSNLQKMV
jgi:hypothetical protein